MSKLLHSNRETKNSIAVTVTAYDLILDEEIIKPNTAATTGKKIRKDKICSIYTPACSIFFLI
jgi:hypothetical protein